MRRSSYIADSSDASGSNITKSIIGLNHALRAHGRSTFASIINLKAAKQIGLTISPHVLAPVDST